MFKKLFIIRLLLLLSTTLVFSQNYEGTIKGIQQTGYHKIVLTPEIRSACKTKIDFFRILDSRDKEVPYLLLSEEQQLTSLYKPFAFKVVSNVKDSITSVIIDNPNRQKLDHLSFTMSNTKVKKTYSISGSNNQEAWFGLTTNQPFYGLNEAEKTTVKQTFSFPVNDYKFLKFDFSNKTSLPLQILDIGLYSNQTSVVPHTEITNVNFQYINDKEHKTTRILVNFNIPQQIDRIAFDVEDDVFLREATIFVKKTRTFKKQSETYQSSIFNFELHSETYNSFELPYIFEKELVIEIKNNDNPPLSIKNIAFYQKPLYVVCNLNTDEAYKTIVDTTLQKPIYDLDKFKNTLNLNIPIASINNFHKIINQNNNSSTKKSFWQTNMFMWLCILLGIVVVGYFALGLLKDLQKNN